MGRGVSSGGGQSSLGYLFGSDEPAKGSKPAAAPAPAAAAAAPPAAQPAAGAGRNPPPQQQQQQQHHHHPAENGDNGVVKLGRNNNNYHRADGQNTGNFITDRPSTKVHAAPGGGSSLGYLFGGN